MATSECEDHKYTIRENVTEKSAQSKTEQLG